MMEEISENWPFVMTTDGNTSVTMNESLAVFPILSVLNGTYIFIMSD